MLSAGLAVDSAVNFRSIEIDMQVIAIRIPDVHLNNSSVLKARHAVFLTALFQHRGKRGKPGGGKRHVFECEIRPRVLWRVQSHQMNQRMSVPVQPRARKRKCRAPAGLKSQNIAVPRDHLFEPAGPKVRVVQPANVHGDHPVMRESQPFFFSSVPSPSASSSDGPSTTSWNLVKN